MGMGLPIPAAAPGGPDITLEAHEQLLRTLPRIVPLPDEKTLLGRCKEKPTIVTFEEFGRGTVVAEQFAPFAYFLDDKSRTPTIQDAKLDRGTATQTPPLLLTNVPDPDIKDPSPPLVITFGTPQRLV